MAFESLFQPIRLGPVEIKNRIAMAPMGTGTCYPGGYANEQVFAYYGARAKGGTGLIITEGVMATRLGHNTTGGPMLALYDTSFVSSLSELVERVHAFGARIFIQLSPGLGRQGSSRLTGVQPVAPSAIPWTTSPEYLPRGLESFRRMTGEQPRELSIAEIEALEDEYAEAVARTRWAGFDGVEIHSPHGYLLHAFLSPRSNKRTDLYGGSLENRMRFLLNIIKKSRPNLGKNMALGARLSGNEHAEGGLTNEDFLVIAKELEKAGLDYINVSDGSYERMKYFFPDEDGTMLEEAAAFKRVLSIPVVTPSLHDPFLAERAVREGMTDMVSLGRQLLADPDWANKLREGRLSEIRRCDRDNKCLLRNFRGLTLKCAINPNSGREKYMPEYWQPPQEV